MRRLSSPGIPLVTVATLLWASVGMTDYFALPHMGPAAYGEVRMAIGGLALAMLIGPRRMFSVLSELPRKHVLAAAMSLALF